MKTLIAGNWKMNPGTYAEARSLARSISTPSSREVEPVLFPPSLYLRSLAEEFPHMLWGVQDVSEDTAGAHTGELSLQMVRDAGASYVLVGHSDRRLRFGETDEVAAKKAQAALTGGFHVVLAVGELKKGEKAEVAESLKKSTALVSEQDLARLTVAYEPVWAISSTPGAEPDTPEHAESVVASLKRVLDVRYIYGGSVNAKNAEGFLRQPNIRGVLAGASSLSTEEFSKILKSVAQ